MQRTTAKRGNSRRIGTRGLPAVAVLTVVSCCGPSCAVEITAKEFCEAQVAAVTQCLLNAVATCRDAAADRLLDGLAAEAQLPRTVGKTAARQALPGVDAHTLLAEYQPLTETARSAPPEVKDEIVRALAGAQASVAAAVSKAITTVTEEDARRLLVEFSLVLPFLATADDRWDAKATEALLRSPLRPECLPVAEGFALHCGRPLTAWEFVRPSGHSTGRLGAQVAYVQSAAARMDAARDPRAAVSCRQAGIRIARDAGDQDALRALTVQLADTLADAGHPLDAARHIEGLLAATAQVTDRSALVARHLVFLYRASAYEEALHAAERERGQTASGNDPALLYMLWACHKRLGHGTEAESAAAEFLGRFPRHSLAADMRLANAMNALTVQDYRTADTMLAQIQTSFPESRYAKRANELRERLAAALGAPAGQR